MYSVIVTVYKCKLDTKLREYIIYICRCLEYSAMDVHQFLITDQTSKFTSEQ